MKTQEYWRQIDWAPKYEISSFGRVKSKTRRWSNLNKEIILKPLINRRGYAVVTILNDYKKYTKTIHRLVAIAFIENENNDPQVNHIDGNKQNNHISNLEWCTNLENKVHSESECKTSIKNIKSYINYTSIMNEEKEIKVDKTKIKLDKGMFAIVDKDDFDSLNKFSWFASKQKHYYYARRAVSINKKQIYASMHRIIMKAQKGQMVDHINHNTLDNRKSNLRFCTQSQNQMNQLKRKNTASRFRGVNLNACTKKYTSKISGETTIKVYKTWIAVITINQKRTCIGRFKHTPEGEILAAKKYDEVVKKHYGEFGNLNFP